MDPFRLERCATIDDWKKETGLTDLTAAHIMAGNTEDFAEKFPEQLLPKPNVPVYPTWGDTSGGAKIEGAVEQATPYLQWFAETSILIAVAFVPGPDDVLIGAVGAYRLYRVGKTGKIRWVLKESRNADEIIGGRRYTGHALDRREERGLFPSVVEDTIRHGEKSPAHSGRTTHYSPENNVTVITDGKDVVTCTKVRCEND